MSTSSSSSQLKPVPTLKGIFSIPKTNYRRDFLRENKLNLRELQNVTNHKKMVQQETEEKLYKHEQMHRKLHQQYVNRRSNSQGLASADCLSARSLIRTRSNPQIVPDTTRSLNRISGGSSNIPGNERIVGKLCHKEIQTDDINDEEFLYNALKKCTSSDCGSIVAGGDNGVPGETLNIDYDQMPNDQDDARSIVSNARSARNYNMPVAAAGDSISCQNLATDMPMDSNYDNVSVTGCSRHSHATARSDTRSLKKNSSSDSVNKLAGRLPRYLEREKREKEEQRKRELEIDPHCPSGHVALTDDERLEALNAANRKFQSLVDELNHMPMSLETYRIRVRKQDIEKQLVDLEADIRILSKQKVFIKKP